MDLTGSEYNQARAFASKTRNLWLILEKLSRYRELLWCMKLIKLLFEAELIQVPVHNRHMPGEFTVILRN